MILNWNLIFNLSKLYWIFFNLLTKISNPTTNITSYFLIFCPIIFYSQQKNEDLKKLLC